ncbi:MAG: hypothetical protein J7K04_06895 [Spirochaetales bacterium]|nr:hypothetical protein [Spirochaetales bacterium]
MYGVFNSGTNPYPGEDPLSIGSATISGGTAEAVAETYNITETWEGEEGLSYDIYMMIDMNGNGDYDEYIDYVYYEGEGFIAVTMDADGVVETVARGDFLREPMPSTFEVYSETPGHDVLMALELTSEAVTVNPDYDSGTSYDGSKELKADFTDNVSERRFTFQFPDHFDINNSSFIVFAIDDSAAVSAGLVSFQLGMSGCWTAINVADPIYRTQTGVGPGNRWDIYKVPIANGDWDGLDLSDIDSLFFKNTSTETNPDNDGEFACTLYFDDIHFE